jgi:hypothetical protein
MLVRLFFATKFSVFCDQFFRTAGEVGVCVNSGSCDDTVFDRFCTGEGKCCAPGTPPTCSSQQTTQNTAVSVTSVVGEFFDGDREAETKLQYCGTSTSAPCQVIKPPSTVQARWSTPSASSSDQTFTGKSGLGFLPNAALNKVVLNEPFPIGTLTHYNFVVNGATPTYVHLKVKMVINGFEIPYFPFRLGIDETNNAADLTSCAYPSVVGCADKIDFADNGFSFNNGQKELGSVKFKLPGSNVDLTLSLTGFKQNCQSASLPFWYTQEKVINQAVLYG